MKKALVVWLFSCSLAQAITWDFDANGNNQGWYARESHTSGAGMDLLPLTVEVNDGILRVYFRPYEEKIIPTVLLVSPQIDYGSALFDRVELRVRLVHSRPLEGRLLLSWTNFHNRQTPGMDPELTVPVEDPQLKDQPLVDHFLFIPSPDRVLYATEWQTLSLRGFAEAPELVWQDTLIDLRLNFVLSRLSSVSGPGDVPEALEVDWIRLTGVEEQLSGELPPPLSPARPVPGALFAPAEFQALSFRNVVRPLLGDVDGDGDLDAVVSNEFNVDDGRNKVWTVAFNEGGEYFRRGAWQYSAEEMANTNAMVYFEGGDFNRNGCIDLALGAASVTEIWVNDQEGAFVKSQRLSHSLRSLVDGDGDGDLDLVVNYNDLNLLLNDGQGAFEERVVLPLENPWRLLDVGDYNEDGQLQAVLYKSVKPYEEATDFLLASFSLSQGLEEQQPFDARVPFPSILYTGDVDNDGRVDLGSTAAIQNEGTGSLSFGLLALLNRGKGHMEQQVWLPQGALLPRTWLSTSRHLNHPRLRTWDLSGDGVPDQVFLDMNPRVGRNVTVLLGRERAMPVQEGQYALPGGIGVEDAGDIDDDGDMDLVVGTPAEGGGLFVLRNLLAMPRSTAIEETVSRPVGFVLGDGYPNPFNGATVLPLTLPEKRVVRIEIHNAVGQRVRRLVDGLLHAGAHRVAWDGRDEWGVEVVSGVYLCRVQVGGRVQVRKLVKVE